MDEAEGCLSPLGSRHHIGALTARGAVGSRGHDRLAAKEARRLQRAAKRKATLARAQLEQRWVVTHGPALWVWPDEVVLTVAQSGQGRGFVSIVTV